MSATIFSFEDFYNFVEREIARIGRYDTEFGEKISLVFIKVPDGKHDEVLTVLKNNLRKSDAIFEKNGAILLILSNTSRMGALHIDEIMKEFFEDDIACVITSFPEDGENSTDLFSMLERILKDEYEIVLEAYFPKIKGK
jgi:hypothetical protein